MPNNEHDTLYSLDSVDCPICWKHKNNEAYVCNNCYNNLVCDLSNNKDNIKMSLQTQYNGFPIQSIDMIFQELLKIRGYPNKNNESEVLTFDIMKTLILPYEKI